MAELLLCFHMNVFIYFIRILFCIIHHLFRFTVFIFYFSFFFFLIILVVLLLSTYTNMYLSISLFDVFRFIYLHTCLYVCLFVCMFVCLFVCMFVCFNLLTYFHIRYCLHFVLSSTFILYSNLFTTLIYVLLAICFF